MNRETLRTIDGGKATQATSSGAGKYGQIIWPESQSPDDAPAADKLPPVVSGMVDEVAAASLAPRGVALLGAITAGAAAYQHRYMLSVERGALRYRSPLSLWGCILARSGSGKSATSNSIMSVFEKYNDEHRQDRASAAARHRDLIDAWDAQKNKEIRQAAEKSGMDSAGSVAYTEYKTKPKRELVPSVLVGTTGTIFGAIDSLLNMWPSAYMVTAEGGTFFGGYNARDENAKDAMAKFNDLWDGKIPGSQTKSEGQKEAADARLSMCVMVQPGVFDDWLKRRGKEAEQSGFLPRFLFCCIPDDHNRSVTGDEILSQHHTTIFQNAINAGLRERGTVGQFAENAQRFTSLPLTFSDAAIDSLVAIHNDYNTGERARKFRDIQAACVRAPEQAARLAGVLHCLEYRTHAHDKDVTADTHQHAVSIIDWCLDQSLVAMGADINQEKKDVIKLAQYIIKKTITIGDTCVVTNDVIRSGPVRGERGWAAVFLGQGFGWWDETGRKEGKKSVIDICPAWRAAAIKRWGVQ
jgi:ABC-type dipeptide/oligopeptide/nickel transport system ATPase component